ncbi:hypothetical protein AALO_G00257890 [Alosa alosa]|uniref:Uncharacterized protein n=1 Tax=Alosa alosa TaxID=278164 RepID=A0AAV6FQL6_9TELE|nr:hypothetical protein AALO_G00257890 [Alosa alosa]
MLSRNILILCSLGVLLVKADLEAGTDPQAMSTDQDSTSDEAPTGNMNAVFPHLPNDEPQYYNGGTTDLSSTSAEAGGNGQKLNDVHAADSTKTSTEEQDENESADSDEAVKNVPVQHSAKSQKPAAAVGKRRKPATTKRRSRPRRHI